VRRTSGVIDGVDSEILLHIVGEELAGVIGAQSSHNSSWLGLARAGSGVEEGYETLDLEECIGFLLQEGNILEPGVIVDQN